MPCRIASFAIAFLLVVIGTALPPAAEPDRVGGTAPEKFADSARTGVPVPSNHNSGYAPVPEPSLSAGVTTMTAAVLELLAKN